MTGRRSSTAGAARSEARWQRRSRTRAPACIWPAGRANLAIGAAAVGLAGREGDIFRRVLFWSIVMLLVMCVLVYLQSTALLSWMVV
jgi:hypothetical protein